MEELSKVIDLSLKAGQLMLSSNCEIYRAEEVMRNICYSYGYKEINIFTLATCIYLSVDDHDQTITKIKRIYHRSTNATRISNINQLSRDIKEQHLDIETCKQRLDEIENEKGYSDIKRAFTMSLSCAVFGKMFVPTATMIAFLITFLITFLCYYLMKWLNRYELNAFILNTLLAMIMTFFAVMSVRVGFIQDIDTIVIGTIMLLVPGVAFTNAVRDLMNGDVLSGTIRTVEGLIIALGIAFGVGVTLYFANIGGLL